MSAKGAPDPDKRDHFLAFVADEDTEAVVKAVIAEMMLPFANVQRGNIKNAAEYLVSRRSPKILLVDLSQSDLPVSDMNVLAEVCEPGVVVLAVGERNDVGLFRDLMGLGVTDYLVKPLSRDLLARSLSGLVEGRTEVAAPSKGAGRSGRLVAVIGARGGAGATTFAVNSAWALANEKSRRVALVDLDLQLGTASLMLDLKPGHGLREAIENPTRLDALFIERAMNRHGERLFVLSCEEPLLDDIPMRAEGVEQLLGILKSQFHYVVVDVPRAEQAVARMVMAQSTAVVIVSEMTLAGARDAARMAAMVRQDVPNQRVFVVANRAGEYKKGELPQADFEKALGRGIDIKVAFDPNVALEAANIGEPVASKGGPVAEGVKRLTAEIGGTLQVGAEKRNGGWFSRIMGSR
jgi:pilus assembly protein CpaE